MTEPGPGTPAGTANLLAAGKRATLAAGPRAVYQAVLPTSPPPAAHPGPPRIGALTRASASLFATQHGLLPGEHPATT